MVRAYGVKVGKRKKRGRYDREGDDGDEAAKRLALEEANGGKKEIEEEKAEDGGETASNEIEGIPIEPWIDLKTNKPGVIFVLEKASLQVGKVGKTYQLLNSDDHSNFLRKQNKNPAEFRPDIVHQALLMILDSPLNKAGRLLGVYISTDKALIEVKPHVRIPRTFKRFSGVMLQLLQNLSIKAVGKGEKLLKLIKKPVSDHLPASARKIGFSFSSNKLVNMRDYVDAAGSDSDLVFVVGAMAHGKIECDYIDDFLSISGYPLSAAFCIARICTALEAKWNIL